MATWRDWPRVCAHIDMDAFFVSVELLRRPELRGQPVIVATGTDAAARGVVMAASYEARRFGVHSALPLATARRRCPQAVLLSRDIALYRRASAKVMEVLSRFSDRIEIAGLDEAYLDLSGSPAPKTRARQLKRDVRAVTGLVCSVGLAPNKLLAKIASDLEKPDGLCVLEPDGMLDAVGERPATLIPGVGERTAERLARLGIRTVADLAAAEDLALERALGPRLGHELRRRAGGRDERPLVTDRERKSESRETTFPADVTDAATLHRTLERLVDSVCRGLAAEGRAGRTVTLKIRLRPFRTHTRSRTIAEPTRDPEVVGAVCRELLAAFELDAPVRLLGVGVSGLAAEAGAAKPSAATTPGPAQGALAIEA
jgi:nucleotidyltransferase/DNA polymerase involved in DNA repair